MPIRVEAFVIGPGRRGNLRVSLGRPLLKWVVDVPAEQLPADLRTPNSEFIAAFERGEVLGVAAAGPAWLDAQNQIRTVLNRDWDPIGVADVVADEYDDYIDDLYWLLSDGATEEAIAKHLLGIETVSMGLAGRPLEALRRTAALLKELSLPAIEGRDSTA